MNDKPTPVNNANNTNDGQTTGEPDYTKPVAYDTQGRPLYLRPSDVSSGESAETRTDNPAAGGQAAGAAGAVAAAAVVDNPPTGAAGTDGDWAPAFNPQSHGNHQYVHVSRPIAPSEAPIPDDIMAKAEESKRKYPHLNLSRGEYIIMAVKRHPIGLFNIWAGAFLAVVVLGGVMASFTVGRDDQSNMLLLVLASLGLVAFLAIGMAMIASYIYRANTFYLTNESVIQEIQVGIFNKHEQTVSLANIEDASYYQKGLLPYMLNYGMIRLSTEGDETTYRFTYVSNPKQAIATLNNAVEAFKNGRPVE